MGSGKINLQLSVTGTRKTQITHRNKDCSDFVYFLSAYYMCADLHMLSIVFFSALLPNVTLYTSC